MSICSINEESPELEIRFVLSGGNMPNSLCCALIRCMRSFSVIPPLPSALRIRSCSGDSTSHMLPHIRSSPDVAIIADSTKHNAPFPLFLHVYRSFLTAACTRLLSHTRSSSTEKTFADISLLSRLPSSRTQDSPKRSLSAAMSSQTRSPQNVYFFTL